MLPAHIGWSSIALLHNVIRTLDLLEARGGLAQPRLRYRAKIKLHGTNGAVQITPHGVFAQGRRTLLTPESDRKGFARWVAAHEAYWAALPPLTVFGEWCGPGVERGMAISALDRKIFAVFALQIGRGEDATLVVDPEAIRAALPDTHPDVYVLPWHAPARVTLDFADPASMAADVQRINAQIAALEARDPWVAETFGVEGVGEGLVFYPEPCEAVPDDPEGFARYMFKAKGDKHRTVGTRAPSGEPGSRMRPEAVSGISGFGSVGSMMMVSGSSSPMPNQKAVVVRPNSSDSRIAIPISTSTSPALTSSTVRLGPGSTPSRTPERTPERTPDREPEEGPPSSGCTVLPRPEGSVGGLGASSEALVLADRSSSTMAPARGSPVSRSGRLVLASATRVRQKRRSPMSPASAASSSMISTSWGALGRSEGSYDIIRRSVSRT